MKITRIERIALDIPYIESVREHLQKGWGLANRATDEEFAAEGDRFHREWRDSKPPTVKTSLYLVHTDDGLTGLGEGASLTDEQLATYTGRSPFNYLGDDSVGPLQMAFYDLMGQALDLPLARVLGPARDTAPLAWWSHCFPPEALRAEAERALARGYRVHKFKRRAHTDVLDQVAAIAEVAPDDYEITVDANQTFGTLERALDIGGKLKAIPQVRCLESPIQQGDIDGYRRLKKELGLKLAHHMGTPDPIDALHSDVYDYFILGVTVGGTFRNAHICGARDKPFWMQLGGDGTDISTLFMLHLAAAIPNATLGHVSMQHLQEELLLNEPLVVEDGLVAIPRTPGLGATLNMDVVDRYRV
jgi:L-alanine-DL-glutamate epimerase-like enolase superfamily enzyme